MPPSRLLSMQPHSHNRASASRLSARRRRRILALLAVVAAIAALVGVAVARYYDPSSAGEAAAKAETRTVLQRRTDRDVKIGLLTNLDHPPQLLIFGGSRATRFEPAYFQRLTGLRGFNLAFQNGRPEDAWAFVNFVHRLHPSTRLHVVWFIHVEAFREQGLSPTLVRDRRLNRWFPPSLVAAERAKLSVTDTQKGRDLALTRYGADGVVLRNRYDLAVERGRTLKRALDWSIDTALERYATTSAALYPRSQRYFEKTLAYLDQMDVTPAIVLMPLHPRLLAAVRTAGWDERHRQVMAYLRDLQKTHRFDLLDCSVLSSFRGDPQDFYDGFHLKKANARKLIAAVVARCPDAFE